MKFEIMSRWEEKTPITQAEIDTQHAIHGDDWEIPTRYILRPIVIDSKDIKGFNKFDEDVTTVRLYGGESISIAQPYEIFREVFSELTGENIKSIRTVSKKQVEEIKKTLINEMEANGVEFEDDEEDEEGEGDFPINI